MPERRYIDVATTQLYGDSLSGKPRGVRYDQGLTAWARLPLTSPTTGGPLVIDVGLYSTAPTVDVRIVEASGMDPRVYEPDEDAELSSDGRSIVFLVPPEVSNTAGVYRAQARVVDENSVERARDEVWLYVDRGFWTTTGDTPSDNGPPTFAEVRTALRDHPAANRLLGSYEFDAAEIGQAVVSAVGRFNTELPPLPKAYAMSTIRMPSGWRRQFLNATVSYLLETGANYFRRGHLPYSSGGLVIDDLAREKDYLAEAMRLRDEFVRWVKLTRTSISMAAAWGSTGSGLPGRSTY